MNTANFCTLLLICVLSYAPGAEIASPAKWDLKIIDSPNVLEDKISVSQKDFWFCEDAYTLSSYMFDFTINTISPGVYFATYRLPIPSNMTQNGIGFMVDNSKRGSIHEGSESKSSFLTISPNDTLRFAYNANTATAYLFNSSTNDLVSLSLEQNRNEYHVQAGVKVTNSYTGSSYANPNRKSVTDYTQTTFGYIYDMESLDNNEDVFLTFVRTLSVNAIPEPTTTTLSLFALAALAGRRRRK